jgi:hypothetical protein
MKNVEQLKEDIKEYFEKKADDYERPKVKIDLDTQAKICTVHICKMYQGLGGLVSFQNLSWLSNQLGTDQINLENDDYQPGCESCDWGSQHSVDIVCKNISL